MKAHAMSIFVRERAPRQRAADVTAPLPRAARRSGQRLALALYFFGVAGATSCGRKAQDANANASVIADAVSGADCGHGSEVIGQLDIESEVADAHAGETTEADGQAGDGGDCTGASGTVWPPSESKCMHYEVVKGLCSDIWLNQITWVALGWGAISPEKYNRPEYFVWRRPMLAQWKQLLTSHIGVGWLRSYQWLRPVYGKVLLHASAGDAMLGISFEWLEHTNWYPDGHGPKTQGYTRPCLDYKPVSYVTGPSANRPWISTMQWPGAKPLEPPCCFRTGCAPMDPRHDSPSDPCGESFALVWTPPIDEPNVPACVRVSFLPMDACDPLAQKVPLRCTIDTPLDFAVCYNGATPASVGWPGVKQVELAPFSP